MRRSQQYTPQSPEDFERVTLGIHETSEANPATPATVRFAITTNLVAANAPILKQRVVEALARGNLQFVVDLAHCRYVDSRGLGVLVSIANQARRAGGSLTVANANEDLTTLFAVTGCDRLFTMSHSSSSSTSSPKG